MFRDVQLLIGSCTHANNRRRTDEPFFAQVHDPDAPLSPRGAADLSSRTERWLPERLQVLYGCIDVDTELHLQHFTILSWNEVQERHTAKTNAGCLHGFVDFMIAYRGMGYVYVWSADANGCVHVREDGGSNDIDRLLNFEASLGPRSSLKRESLDTLSIESLLNVTD